MVRRPRTDRLLMEFSTVAPVDVLLERIDQRAALDALAEARRAKWQRRGIFAFAGVVVGFVLVVLAGSVGLVPEPAMPMVMGILLAILAPVAIFSFVQASRQGRADVEDRKYELVRGVVRPLVPEIRTRRDCAAAIDFTDYADREPRSSERPGGMFGSLKLEAFEHPWLELELPLRDGSTAVVRGATSCKRKSKRKRKYTKVTDKLREKLWITVLPPRGGALDAAESEARARRLAAIPGLEVTGIRASARALELRFRTGVGVVVSGRGARRDTDALLDADKVLRALAAGFVARRGGAAGV